MTSRAQRRRQVSWVLVLTEGTTLDPGPYERHLLAQYVDGVLTLEEMCDLADAVSQDQWACETPNAYRVLNPVRDAG